ncbi:MAG TPA: hypothetical protein VK449_03340 [Anaerolineales bacterium]|nr:hypothetical protein [Anaerolineales bacterium]
MEVTRLSGNVAEDRPAERQGGFLREALEAHRARFAAQPPQTKQDVDAEGRRLGALLSRAEPVWHASFLLPEIVAVGPNREPRSLPPDRRLQHVGRWMDRVRGRGLRATLRVYLLTLEQSPDRAVATAAKLIRHATAGWIVAHVGQVPGDAEEPSQGLAVPTLPEKAAPSNGDGHETPGPNGQGGHGSAPAVEAPRVFSVPEWEAFDAEGRLLVETPAQAESYLGLMQDSLAALRAAISLAPYMVADARYQAKRAGLLRQLAEQGRSLARYQTHEIVAVLQRRTSQGQLNRGLKVSLPYYDDQSLRLMLRTFDVIPAGRIMYVPALGMRAVQDEQAKVAQDTRLTSATRDHLLEELEMLVWAFRGPAANSAHA